jgi:hypothetical protein
MSKSVAIVTGVSQGRVLLDAYSWALTPAGRPPGLDAVRR